ncbi:DNA repair protein RecN [Wohlfahrtiimonas larvae]|uniref:DNA repair protein RecN n=1 Tax=Wohlfahrtiimonas larvae TaxID=1157986 RepID=A0ABP9MPY5_9GAMM|nr:DNA repair protein RecN [Wohlfahrtiimonas larvae]
MLVELTIENLAIIENLSLEFDRGLSVISGETGAGKSITVDALSYILGGKVDHSLISHDKSQCNLVAHFDVSDIPKAKTWLQEQLIESEDGECIIRRVINKEGRSKNYINGQSMPLHALKSLGELLIDIHGQHAHQSLVKDGHQRELLDQYAETESELIKLQILSKEIRQRTEQLHQLKNRDDSMRERIDFLNFQLQEFKNISPKQGEWESILEQHNEASHAEEFQDGIQKCLNYLNDDRGVLTQLNRIGQQLTTLAKLDDKFKSYADMINEADILCSEVANDLNRMDNTEVDEKTLMQLESRMRELNDLARKHRVEPEELLTKQQDIETEIASQFLSDEAIEDLENELKEYQIKWQKIADKITQKRQKAIIILNKQITNAMQGLSMTGGAFDIRLHPEKSFGPHGQENVEFHVRSNPGMPFYPLGKVASGGELARISLAISVILSMKSSLPTLIFDEVDTGVGGAVAEMIGKHLQELSEGRQVFCVTHLPQVASFGHHHFAVAKTKSDNHTETQIKKLSKEERVQEIARMLGGVKLTEATFNHAREMLTASHSL